MILKAEVQRFEFRSRKKKKKHFPNSLVIEVTGPDLRRQFRKNQNLGFYGPKGTGLDL